MAEGSGKRTPPRFAVGDKVYVKPGTPDPDYPDIPLGGWAGTVTEVEEGSPPLYLVRLSQHTIRNVHPICRKRCERDGFKFGETWLSEGELLPDTGEPVPMEQPTNIVTKPLSVGDQDDRVRAALGLTSDDPLPAVGVTTLLKYHEYLAGNLSFPFEAKSPLDGTWGQGGDDEDVFTVLGLLDASEYRDEDWGLFCQARKGARVFDLPLADMEVTKGSANRQLADDYSYWFGNYQ